MVATWMVKFTVRLVNQDVGNTGASSKIGKEWIARTRKTICTFSDDELKTYWKYLIQQRKLLCKIWYFKHFTLIIYVYIFSCYEIFCRNNNNNRTYWMYFIIMSTIRLVCFFFSFCFAFDLFISLNYYYIFWCTCGN